VIAVVAAALAAEPVPDDVALVVVAPSHLAGAKVTEEQVHDLGGPHGRKAYLTLDRDRICVAAEDVDVMAMLPAQLERFRRELGDHPEPLHVERVLRAMGVALGGEA
jgi:hypothetical protein